MSEIELDEALYRALNPDVDEDVEAGRFADATTHWRERGAAETSLALRPTVDNPRFYSSEADASHQVTDPTMSRPRRVVNVSRMLAKPFGINLYAPVSTQSGLGKAARGYLQAIRAAGIPVDLYNINYDLKPIQITAKDRIRTSRYRINLVQVNADNLKAIMALFGAGHFSDAYTIAIWAWELNILRPDWFSSFREVDEVWGLSDFNTAAIAALSPVPVRTIPPVVAVPHIDPRYDRAYFGLPTGFLFLTAFDVGSSLLRKNPYAVIDAFDAAFKNDRDINLLLKFHSGANDRPALQALMQYVRGRQNIIIRAEKLSDAEMHALQSLANCLVSAHRAEGFGLNIAEFMLLGKPVITTGYSGNMDFTTEQNSYLISYTMRPLTRSSGPYCPGYLWAEPDSAELTRLMRRAVDAPAEATRLGAAGATTVRMQFSAEAVGERLHQRLGELGLDKAAGGSFTALAGATRSLALPPADAVQPLHDLANLKQRPTISIIVAVRDVAAEWLHRCIVSVQGQTYPRWELCLCYDAAVAASTLALLGRFQGVDPRIRIMQIHSEADNATAANAAVLMATGCYLFMLDGADELSSDAIHQVTRAVGQNTPPDILYADQDIIDGNGDVIETYKKPPWSIEYLESSMYVMDTLIINAGIFLASGGFRAGFGEGMLYDLLLRLSRRTTKINQIPHILYHKRSLPSLAKGQDVMAPALKAHVQAKFGDAAVVSAGERTGTYRVRHVIRNFPSVCVVVLGEESTAAQVDAIRDNTAHFQLGHLDVLVLPTGPTSWPAQANAGFRLAQSEHVVWVGPDLEFIDRDWLTSLIEFSQNAEIGLCGGRTLPAAAKGRSQSEPDVIRNYTALSGGPLAIRREALWQVGGFDEGFGAEYATLDLCLRLNTLGYRIAYTPFAKLQARSNYSGDADLDTRDAARFKTRWGSVIGDHPYGQPILL